MSDYNAKISEVSLLMKQGEALATATAKADRLKLDNQYAADTAQSLAACKAGLLRISTKLNAELLALRQLGKAKMAEITAKAAEAKALSSADTSDKDAQRQKREERMLHKRRIERHLKEDQKRRGAARRWRSKHHNTNYPFRVDDGPPYDDHPSDPNDPLSISNYPRQPREKPHVNEFWSRQNRRGIPVADYTAPLPNDWEEIYYGDK